MAEKESLNFYKLSTLLLDIGKDVLSKRIQQECSNNSVSFEDFLNRLVNKDTLLHLWKSVKCCNAHCNKSRAKTILNNVQWDQLYASSGTVGHVKRNPNGRICQECTCNYTARVGILSDSLDLSLASCILLSLCKLLPVEKHSIESLRELRNSVFAHASEAKVSDPDYCVQWQNIEREIAVLSSHFDSATEALLDERIKHLQQTPFVDKEILQSFVSRILLQFGQASCILEEMKDIAEDQSSCINRASLYKIQKMTQAETEAYDFIPTKAYEQGLRCIKRHGVAIFTGNSGSGKTTNALGILRRVKEGEFFEDVHNIQHINIDNWDSQVDIDQNTVVFLEDPLGTTNGNTALTEHDDGTFRKIWTCIQRGKVKVILTVRSNILLQNKVFLKRHAIFNEKHVINLSDGKYSLDKEEKKQLVQLYCTKNNVNIFQDNVKKLDDINLERDSAMSLQIGESTIADILKSDPQIGFPLCCRDFFENRKNISLGARYFSQPSEIKLNEMRNLAVSESESESCQFAVLIYMLINNSSIDVSNIDEELMEDISEELGLTGLIKKKSRQIRSSLNKLNNQFISKCPETQSIYKYVHATVLESVFVSACEEVPNLVLLLFSKVDIKVICELVRTENIEDRENEVCVKIAKGHYKVLAERFIKELKERRFKQIVTHVSMSDNGFIGTILSELKKCPNLPNNEDVYVELFNAACLFDKTNLVDTLLKTDFISFDMILEGSMICTKFDNVKTFKILIPRMLTNHLQKTFISSCKQGKRNILDNIITLANKAILSKHFEQGLEVACSFGNIEIVQYILSYGIENGHEKGLKEACGKGHVHIVKLLLNDCKSLTSDEIVAGFVKACAFGHADVGILILSFLPTVFINQAIIEAMECCDGRTLTCLIDNENMFSDETIRHCLSKVCNSKNTFRSKSTEHFNSYASADFADCRPFCSFSDRRFISAPGQYSHCQNLFPEIVSNSDLNSEDHFKAIFFKAILNSRPNFPKTDLIDIFIEAYNNNLVEVACVIVKKMFHIHSQMSCIDSILTQAYEAGHTDIFDLLSSTRLKRLCSNDISSLMLTICRENDIVSFRKVLKARVHYTVIIEIAMTLLEQGRSNLFRTILEIQPSLFAEHAFKMQFLNAASDLGHGGIIACMLDSFPDIPLQDIINIWNNLTMKSHFKSAQILLEKRKDIPHPYVIEYMYQTLFSDNSEMISNALTTRPDLPSYEILNLAKYSYSRGIRHVCQMIVIDKLEFPLVDILKLLDDVIERNDHDFFENIIRKYSSIGLNEIGQHLTATFMKKYKINILDTLSNIHPKLRLDEIESNLLLGMEKSRNIKMMLRELGDAIRSNDLDIVEKIIDKYIDIPSKTQQNVQILPSLLNTDQIHKCLLQLCGMHKPDKSIIELLIQLLPPPLTTDQILKCLLQLCGMHKPDKSIIEIFIKLLPSPLTTYQIHKCILQLCKFSEQDKSIIEMFVQLLASPLATEPLHQSLLRLCERSKPNKSIIEMFLQLLPSHLTTNQIHQCLLQLCERAKPDKSIIEMFVQLLALPLTTDQLHQCLFRLCERSKPHKSIIEMFVQLLPSHLTTNQIHQCLLQLCERAKPDKSIIEMYIQLLPSCLRADQINQCLLQLCERTKPDKSLIEMYIQLLPSYLTADVFYNLKQNL